MVIFTSSYRLIRTSGQHIFRNFWHSVGAVLVMSLTLFLISTFVFVVLGLNVVLTYFEAKPQVTAFFLDQATEEEILTIKGRLEETGEVKEIVYVSKEEALKRYREQNQSEPILLEMVTADILPASLEVSATDIVYLSHLASLLDQEALVEEVIFQQNVVDTLRKWTDAVRVGGIVLASFFAAASVLIVLITISMNIATRTEEIEIMRLVGASSWYIRWPFILEGAAYGVISALLAVGSIYFLLPKIAPTLSTFLAGIPIFPIPHFLWINLFWGEIGLGIVIGITGSLIAIWRHLKV